MCSRAVVEDPFGTKNPEAKLLLFATYGDSAIDIQYQLPLCVSFPYLAEEWQKIAACVSCECNSKNEGHLF